MQWGAACFMPEQHDEAVSNMFCTTETDVQNLGAISKRLR